MTIFLGRQLPGASSDLPRSRNGSGRPVSDRSHKGEHPNSFPSSIQSALLLYLILLPMGFAKPGRSPGLLVSSYLAFSPLPRLQRLALPPRRFIFCGTFPVRAAYCALGRWALPTTAPYGVRTFLRGTSRDRSCRAGLPALQLTSTRRGDHRAHHEPRLYHMEATSTGQLRRIAANPSGDCGPGPLPKNRCNRTGSFHLKQALERP
jgi:hypothetical protein